LTPTAADSTAGCNQDNEAAHSVASMQQPRNSRDATTAAPDGNIGVSAWRLLLGMLGACAPVGGAIEGTAVRPAQRGVCLIFVRGRQFVCLCVCVFCCLGKGRGRCHRSKPRCCAAGRHVCRGTQAASEQIPRRLVAHSNAAERPLLHTSASGLGSPLPTSAS
jgi:hypothetical protein